MKNMYTLLLLIFISLNCCAKTYFIYTAKANGRWSNAGTWNTSARKDNVQKDKFIIPAAFTVIGDDDVNSVGFTDIEMQIFGKLTLEPSTSLHFGSGSRIEIFASGAINANGASQQIYIGAVSKYTGNKNKNLHGPLYADASTGTAPNGFSAYAALPAAVSAFSVTISHDQTVSLKWSVTGDMKASHYQVETRSQNSDWSLAGVVVAGKERSYTFTHQNMASGTISYRLKQVTGDGKMQYSNVVSITGVKHPASAHTNIYAVNKTVNIDLAGDRKTPVEVKIMSMSGYVLNRKTFKPASKISLAVDTLKAGPYLVCVSDNVNKETIRRVFIY
jgi:hypothetical protein